MKRKITIIIDDGEDEREIGDFGETMPVVNPGEYHWEISPRYGVEDNGLDDDQDTNIFRPNNDENYLVIKPGSYYWEKQKRQKMRDNGWVDGIDVCANCPNRPGGPNNKSGFCNCAIPSMYGPNRVTC